MSKSETDEQRRRQAADLIQIAIGRLQRVYDSPETSSYNYESKIALADLKTALDVLTQSSSKNHQKILPDLRLLVHRLEDIDEQNIIEAHDDILEACLLIEHVIPQH
ncbi:MAG TPA: hypothetical protein VIY68_18520 [Steroidobacteraceae bacterium]